MPTKRGSASWSASALPLVKAASVESSGRAWMAAYTLEYCWLEGAAAAHTGAQGRVCVCVCVCV